MDKRIDPRDIRAQERHLQDLTNRQRLAEEQAAEDLRWLMQAAQGRRFMARLLDMSGIERTSFTGSSTTFYNEGRRSIGVELTAEIKQITPDDYIAMLQEQRK